VLTHTHKSGYLKDPQHMVLVEAKLNNTVSCGIAYLTRTTLVYCFMQLGLVVTIYTIQISFPDTGKAHAHKDLDQLYGCAVCVHLKSILLSLVHTLCLAQVYLCRGLWKTTLLGSVVQLYTRTVS
jgi:hypothetical protein